MAAGASGLRDAPALVRELAALKVRFGARGHASFAGAGEHDDLVVAVALVCWWRAVGRRHTQTALMAPRPVADIEHDE